jgi:hypothetical protein
MTRPFIQDRIDELEQLFAEKGTDLDFLKTLLDELSHRRRPRAKAPRALILLT